MHFSPVTAINPLFGFVGDPDSLIPHGHGAALVECSLPTFNACMSSPGHMLIILPFPGIWMSRGQDMNVLVMDVEGTDGRERGEDQVYLLNYGSARCLTNF